MIEQKGWDKDLRKPIRQSDGSVLTPFQQAKRYAAELPYSLRPRWIVVCNFRQFLVYDMETPSGEPEEILLENLPREYYRLKFLVDTGSDVLKREMEVSIKAGQLVGSLYDEILKQYINPGSEETLKSLNILCVRLVFCLYAEDAGIFGSHTMFHDYLVRFEPRDLRRALIDLFKVLDTKMETRDPYMDADLLAFPYVNGGLFADENIEIPQFTEEIANLLLHNASEDFDWSDISPTIFGAVFESTLNPETRRKGGMHYTSIENIHKLIDPLFLDNLKAELEEIKGFKVEKTRQKRAEAYQEKLAGLTFLDPACGSGNFLTETYISLRRLENEAISIIQGGNIGMLEALNPIKVSIGQFYGIEINDFAVTVAKTALWIAESQMMKETEDIVHMSLDFLPLKSYANIVEGNALRLDWESVAPKNELDYIMGNPPFVGYSLQSKEQKTDIRSIYIDANGKPYKTAGKIDYVAGWYFKASEFMQGTGIRTAFVSTNSITQGEQVAGVWKPLYDRFNIRIDFAWRTFKWNSEAAEKAAVHCVIVGFSQNKTAKDAPVGQSFAPAEKRIYINENIVRNAKNINPYLVDADHIFIESRKKPLCDVPEMITGNRPADGGHLIIEEKELTHFLKAEPKAEKFIRPFMGSVEFINNKPRWCLWLVGAEPKELLAMPKIIERVQACKEDRLSSPDAGRRKLAETPTLFREQIEAPNDYLLIPKVSSENRRYIPIGFLNKEVIASDLVFMIPNGNLFNFGVLISNVHNAWMRAVAGRLEMRYRYSKDIVYNNFPWPLPTEVQKAKIEHTAQAILDARALYPSSSLADLYNETVMPPELRKAHQANDHAVWEAYGKQWDIASESDCVACLMTLYQQIAGQ